MSRATRRPLTALAAATTTLLLGSIALTPAPAANAANATATSSARASAAAARKPAAKAPVRKPAAKAPAPKPAAKTPARKPAAKAPASKPAAAAPATATFSSRVTAQPRPVKDRAGRVWAPLPATLGSTRVSQRLAKADIARTTDDAIYRANVWGTPGYLLPVPAKGTYTVRLHFAEDAFGRAGQRVFDVKAEGKLVARNVDIARAVGRGAAHTVAFKVPVSDGQLDLDFVKRVDLPLVSAIEVTGTKPVARSLLTAGPTHTLGLARGNVFQQSVRRAPLAPNSSRVAAHVRAQVTKNWGGVAAVNAYSHNVGFHEVPRGTKRVTVGYHNCQRKSGTPRGLYDGPKHFVDVPVPANATAAAGSDREMTIYDRSTDQMWDLWQMRRNAKGAWEACWGGRMDGVSKQQRLVFPEYFGTAASGLSLGAGMVSIDDVRRGRIDHAVAITVIDAARWSNVSWPASRSDGISSHPDAVREGQRLRLDPNLDLSKYDLTPFARLVAEAAQEYGFIVVDKGGAVAVQTEFGQQRKLGGKDAWDWFLGGTPHYAAMKNFPWQGLQTLPVDYGKYAAR